MTFLLLLILLVLLFGAEAASIKNDTQARLTRNGSCTVRFAAVMD
jgi:hypothetical protein